MAKKKPKPAYKIVLTLGDKAYQGEGATLLEALQHVPKPDKIVSKGILTITHAGKTFEQPYWNLGRMRRLFYNPNFQVLQAKNLTLAMK